MSGSSPQNRLDEIGRTLRHAQATRSTGTDSWLNGYQDDVSWLLEQIQAERDERFKVEVAASLLHEQLEAQEAVLRAYVGRFGLILPTDEPRAEVSFPASRQDG